VVEDSILLACDTASSVPNISKEHSAFIFEDIVPDYLSFLELLDSSGWRLHVL